MPAAAPWSARSRRSATSIIIAPATPISARATRLPAAANMSARKRSKRSSPNCSGGFSFDDEVLEWVRDALHASHADERREHEEAIKRHQAEYKRLQDRIHAMYVDKLDGLVDTAFYEKMSNQWREEQNRCQREIDGTRTPTNPTGRRRRASRPRPQRPTAVREAGTARKTPPAELRAIELHLGGWRSGRHFPPTL